MSKSPIVLTILDGWGYRAQTSGNAIALARKPTYDKLGHLNLGAGRIVRMDMTRIDTAIADGSFYSDPTLTHACQLVGQQGTALHIIGLLSDGGVHSHQRHLYALLRLAKQQNLTRVYVHAFMDGRDTKPSSINSARSASASSPQSPAATTPWTATSAGKKSSRPSTPWSPGIPKAAATPILSRE
jgi:2,3-bisphosphoglycerate-independent phosphoglycerate mutase